MLSDVELIKSNMYAKLAFIARGVDSKLVIENEDYVYLSSNTKSDLFNHLYCKKPLGKESLDFVANKIAEQRELRLHPDQCLMALLLSEDTTLSEQLIKLGMRPIMTETGMLLVKDDYSPLHKVNEDIELVHVTNKGQLDKFTSVICQYIPEDAEMVKQYFADAASVILENDDKLKFFYAQFNGVYIATCVLYVDGVNAELSDVITLPRFRNLGVASTLTGKALDTAFAVGAHKVTLSSSDMAYKIYNSFGFKPFINITIMK